MQIRDARDTDLRPIVALFTRSVHGLGMAHYTQAQLAAWAPRRPDLDRWRSRLASRHVVVAESGGRIVGFAASGPATHLDLLYVDPDHARRGVGAALLSHMEHEARRAGVRGMETAASLVARPFFERHGYVVDGEEEVDMGGTPLRRFRMHKRFDGPG